jgi:hypothetical protein
MSRKEARMRARACCAVALLTAAAARAKEGVPEELAASLEASGAFAGSARFDEADLTSFLEHFDECRAWEEEGPGEEKGK